MYLQKSPELMNRSLHPKQLPQQQPLRPKSPHNSLVVH
jgi:hypothetical protein